MDNLAPGSITLHTSGDDAFSRHSRRIEQRHWIYHPHFEEAAEHAMLREHPAVVSGLCRSYQGTSTGHSPPRACSRIEGAYEHRNISHSRGSISAASLLSANRARSDSHIGYMSAKRVNLIFLFANEHLQDDGHNDLW